MIVIHHNKDMDGYCSGAICKLKYPDAQLIGWDYKDPIPDLLQFTGKEVILIDITFPLNILLKLGSICKLTVIDHHISFKKQVDEYNNFMSTQYINFKYIYEAGVAACEIGWKHLFPDKKVPYGITLISRYDVWNQTDGDWKKETLPFKYYMYGQCNSAETFSDWVFQVDLDSDSYDYSISYAIGLGMAIMKYQETMDEAATRYYSFEIDAYGGLKALVVNFPYFSAEVLKTKFDPSKHNIMIGFCYTGTKWSVSLRSIENGPDVSMIAKARGGGGHKNAAGFEVDDFQNIFI